MCLYSCRSDRKEEESEGITSAAKGGGIKPMSIAKDSDFLYMGRTHYQVSNGMDSKCSLFRIHYKKKQLLASIPLFK